MSLAEGLIEQRKLKVVKRMLADPPAFVTKVVSFSLQGIEALKS
jgi:hypothetical protein